MRTYHYVIHLLAGMICLISAGCARVPAHKSFYQQQTEDSSPARMWGRTPKRSSRSDIGQTKSDRIGTELDKYGDVSSSNWTFIRESEEIVVRKAVVPYIVTSDGMRVRSVPGTEATRDEITEFIKNLFTSAGYRLSSGSPLYVLATYHEEILVEPGLILAPGASAITLGGSVGSTLHSLNVQMFLRGTGLLREIQITSTDGVRPLALRTIAKRLNTRWPFVNSVDKLATGLSHADAAVRKSAATALGLIYPNEADSSITQLKNLYENDEDWRVRRAAGIAVQRIEKVNP